MAAGGINTRGEQPSADDSYAKRIAYRLKRWNDVDMTRPYTAVN
jgi:hypothetical protein